MYAYIVCFPVCSVSASCFSAAAEDTKHCLWAWTALSAWEGERIGCLTVWCSGLRRLSCLLSPFVRRWRRVLASRQVCNLREGERKRKGKGKSGCCAAWALPAIECTGTCLFSYMYMHARAREISGLAEYSNVYRLPRSICFHFEGGDGETKNHGILFQLTPHSPIVLECPAAGVSCFLFFYSRFFLVWRESDYRVYPPQLTCSVLSRNL